MEHAGSSNPTPKDAVGTSKPAMESDAIVSDDGVTSSPLLRDLGATRVEPQRWRGGWLVTAVILLAIFVALAAGFIGGLTYTTLVTSTVYARFETDYENIGPICAGAIVEQKNFMTAHGPAVINMVGTIYNTKNEVIRPGAENYWIAVKDERSIRDIVRWQAPELPPDDYFRVFGANSESVQAPAMQVTEFSVVDCDENGIPIVSPADSEPTP